MLLFLNFNTFSKNKGFQVAYFSVVDGSCNTKTFTTTFMPTYGKNEMKWKYVKYDFSPQFYTPLLSDSWLIFLSLFFNFFPSYTSLPSFYYLVYTLLLLLLFLGLSNDVPTTFACKDCPMITCHPPMMTDWTEVLEPFLLQVQFQDNPQVNHQGKKKKLAQKSIWD